MRRIWLVKSCGGNLRSCYLRIDNSSLGCQSTANSIQARRRLCQLRNKLISNLQMVDVQLIVVSCCPVDYMLVLKSVIPRWITPRLPAKHRLKDSALKDTLARYNAVKRLRAVFCA